MSMKPIILFQTENYVENRLQKSFKKKRWGVASLNISSVQLKQETLLTNVDLC